MIPASDDAAGGYYAGTARRPGKKAATWLGRLGACCVPGKVRRFVARVMPPPVALSSDVLRTKLKINACRLHEGEGGRSDCHDCQNRSVEALMASGQIERDIMSALEKDANFQRAKLCQALLRQALLSQALLSQALLNKALLSQALLSQA